MFRAVCFGSLLTGRLDDHKFERLHSFRAFIRLKKEEISGNDTGKQ